MGTTLNEWHSVYLPEWCVPNTPGAWCPGGSRSVLTPLLRVKSGAKATYVCSCVRLHQPSGLASAGEGNGRESAFMYQPWTTDLLRQLIPGWCYNQGEIMMMMTTVTMIAPKIRHLPWDYVLFNRYSVFLTQTFTTTLPVSSIIIPFYRWGNRSPKMSNLPVVTQFNKCWSTGLDLNPRGVNPESMVILPWLR